MGEGVSAPKILQLWVAAPPPNGCCILQLILALLKHQGLDFYPGEGRISPKFMRVLQIYQQGKGSLKGKKRSLKAETGVVSIMELIL